MTESNISYNETIGMYKQDMGFYSKYFDFLFYDFDDIQKSFGEVPSGVVIDDNLQIKDKVIGITDYFGYKLVCIQDLKTFTDKYYVVSSAEFFSVKLKKKDYVYFVYRNLDGEIRYWHNIDLDDFYVSIEGNSFIIYNKVLDAANFQKDLILPELLVKSETASKLKGWTDVLDLNFFPDWFGKDSKCDDVYKILKGFEDKVIDGNFMMDVERYDKEGFPLWRVNIKVRVADMPMIDLRPILSLFRSFYPNQYLAYSIKNENIVSQLEGFLQVNKADVNKVNINFDLPESIMYYDASFIEFQQDFMRLKYGFYILKENYRMLDSVSSLETQNPHVMAAQERMKMNKEAVGKIIKAYEKTFNNLLEKLEKLIEKVELRK